jgi:hypothetical protein
MNNARIFTLLTVAITTMFAFSALGRGAIASMSRSRPPSCITPTVPHGVDPRCYTYTSTECGFTSCSVYVCHGSPTDGFTTCTTTPMLCKDSTGYPWDCNVINLGPLCN